MKTRILIFLIGIFVVSCKNDKTVYQDDIVIDQGNYMQFAQDNFTVYYPKGWKIEKNPQPEIPFFLFLENDADDFTENINLMVVPNIGSMNLEKITQNAIKEHQTSGGKIIASQRIKTPTREYQKLVTVTKMNDADLKFIQHYYHTPSKIYLLTFTAQKKDFAQYEKEAEQVMRSFELK